MVENGIGGGNTKAGKVLEKKVSDFFKNKYNFSHIGKYEVLKFKESKNEPLSDDIIADDVPYRSIYETNGHTEFYLKSKTFPSLDDTRVECKLQNVGGTTREKIEYFVSNMREDRFPETNTILVTDGEGLIGLTPILRKLHCKKLSTNGKTFLVMTYSELEQIVKLVTTPNHKGNCQTFNDMVKHIQ